MIDVPRRTSVKVRPGQDVVVVVDVVVDSVVLVMLIVLESHTRLPI